MMLTLITTDFFGNELFRLEAVVASASNIHSLKMFVNSGTSLSCTPYPPNNGGHSRVRRVEFRYNAAEHCDCVRSLSAGIGELD